MSKAWMSWAMAAGLAGTLTLSAVSANANDRAKTDYMNLCASCHGADGTGDGPMASGLKATPTDLTVLAKNNGGNFPYKSVGAVIDGSYETGKRRPHGSSDMPVWGDVFRRDASSSDRTYSEASTRIMNIVTHIVALQK